MYTYVLCTITLYVVSRSYIQTPKGEDLKGILEYPDGSSKMLRLPDATVKYLSVKHIPLFIAAVYRLSLKATTHRTLLSIIIGLDCC